MRYLNIQKRLINTQIVFVALLLLAGSFLLAQPVDGTEVYGKVINRVSQQAVEYAMVIARDTVNNITKFTNAGINGEYTLRLPLSNSYLINVHALGFKDSTFILNLRYTSQPFDLYLQPASNNLAEITVRDTLPPITYRPDTVTYNAHSFYTGRERKLQDLIDRMPGLEIDDQKNITYQGQPVSALLVENKPFFGGNSQLALEGLPANAIGRVQVFENYDPTGMGLALGGRNQKIALNILIREDKKSVNFGDVSVAAGIPKTAYSSKANLFRYDRKANFYAIGEGNNINRQALNTKQIIQLLGGTNQLMRGNLDTPTELVFRFQPPRLAAEANSQLFAIGADFRTGKNTEAHAHVIVMNRNYRTNSLTETAFSQPNGSTLSEITASNGSNKSWLSMGNFNSQSTWKQQQQLRINANFYRLSASFTEGESYQSDLINRNNLLAQDNYGAGGKVSAEYVKRYKNGHDHIAVLTMQGSINNETADLRSDAPFLTSLTNFANGSDEYAVEQQLTDQQLEFDFTDRWSYKLNTRIHLRATGSLGARQFVLEGNGRPLTINRLTGWANHHAGGLELYATPANWDIVASMKLKQQRWRVISESARFKRTALLPDLNISRSISGFGKITFFARRDLSTFSSDNVRVEPVVVNFLTFRRGNVALPPLLMESLQLNYRRNAILTRTQINVSTRFERSRGPRPVSQLSLQNTDRELQIIAVSEPLQVHTTLASFQKTYKKGSLKIGGSYVDRIDGIVLTGKLVQDRTSYLSAVVSAKRDFAKFASVNATATYFRQLFYSGPMVKAVNQFESNISGSVNYGHYLLTWSYAAQFFDLLDENAPITHDLSGRLAYKQPESPWSFYLEGIARFGGASEARYFQSVLFYTASRFSVLPGFFLLGLQYDF